MNAELRKNIIDCLARFIERASSANANPAEVQILPEIARILLDTPDYFEVSITDIK